MQIRFMKDDDIDFALRLTTKERWSDIRSDFELLIAYDPPAAFIVEEEGHQIAMISAVSYGNVGFIGSLIVLHDHRGKGIGTTLMRYAIRYLEGLDCNNIMLDAVPEAVPIYEHLGFKKCCRSLRMSGIPKVQSNQARRMRDEDIQNVIALDSSAFGEDRSHFLRARFHEFPKLCYVIEEEQYIVGFAIGSDRENTVRIAPWIISGQNRNAGDLIKAIAAARQRKSLSIGLLETNIRAYETLLELGFQQTSFSIRMYRGPKKPDTFSDMMYAIGSPAKG